MSSPNYFPIQRIPGLRERFIPPVTTIVGDLEGSGSLSLNASKSDFEGFVSSKPTLEDALRSAGVQNLEWVLDEALVHGRSAKAKPEIAALGLTDDEAGAIACYTLSSKDGAKPPYLLINEGLAGARSRDDLCSIRKLLYLLLSGLRKLPRFRPSPGQLYRGIEVRGPQGSAEANGDQLYSKGMAMTWRGFSSTTTKLGVISEFTKGRSSSTLFDIGGPGLWGYDIKAFSSISSEEEILLEPEAKFLVDEVAQLGEAHVVKVTFQPFDRLVLEDIIPAKSAREKWRCGWGECPDTVHDNMRYALDGNNPRVATRIDDHGKNCWSFCTIVGDTPLPPSKLTSWDIKIAKSRYNNGHNICVGVAPADINRNDSKNYEKCGWHFHCGGSELFSGPPHNYRAKPLGPRKENEKYVRTGDTISVAVDTLNGGVRFAVNGVSDGDAYSGIPLDKPLVPCVILWYEGDSVELII